MSNGEEQLDQSTFEIINGPERGGASAKASNSNDDPATQEEKKRTFERVEREMEVFRKGEYTRFQALTHVANELDKWVGASDKDKGKALDSYLAEINSLLAVQDEDRSATRGTSHPVGANLLTESQSNRKRIREEVDELLDQISGEELEEDEVEQRVIRKRAKEEDMPWFSSTSNSSRRGSCVATCRTLLKFSEDLPGVKSLLRVAYNLPDGIPSSQWDQIL